MMIALENEASLRVGPGPAVEIVCMAGVVWVTQEGDVRDIFLGCGDSCQPAPRGLTVVTALEPSLVRLVERAGTTGAWSGLLSVLRWMRVAAAALARPQFVVPRVPMIKR